MHDTWRARVRQAEGRHTHPPAGCRDSHCVNTTALGGECGSDRGQQVQGRTRHRLVETRGLRLAVLVTAASVSDPAGARLRLARLGGAWKPLHRLWVDGTSRGQLGEWLAQQRPFWRRVTWRPEGRTDVVLLPRRWGVERTLAWLNQSRRLRKDDERLPMSREAMLVLSMTRLMLRRLTAT